MRGAVHLPLCPNVNTRERQLLICLPAKLISTFYVGEGRQGGYVESVVVSAVFSRTTARVTVGVQGDARTLNSSTISSIPPHSPPTRKFCSSTFYKRHPRYPPSLLANEARVDTQRCTSRKLALGTESGVRQGDKCLPCTSRHSASHNHQTTQESILSQPENQTDNKKIIL